MIDSQKPPTPRFMKVIHLLLVGSLTLGLGVLIAALLGARFPSGAETLIAPVMGLVLALIALVMSVGGWKEARKAVVERGVQGRADAVRRHLSSATQLLQELEDDLAVRMRILEQHQADAERYEHLASLNAEQAKAIENLVGSQFARQSRSTWVQWIASLLAAFVLGLVVNWISAPALAWVSELWR